MVSTPSPGSGQGDRREAIYASLWLRNVNQGLVRVKNLDWKNLVIVANVRVG